MSRNLYILAASLFAFAVISFAMTFSGSSSQMGLPANGSLWKMIGFVLLLGSLVAALAGVMRALFEQVERRNYQREMRELERSVIDRVRNEQR